MKSKTLFLWILFTIILLIIACLWIEKIKEINANNSTLYEEIPIKKTVQESQKEIALLLKQNPIKFLDNGYLLEDNKTIDKVVFILNQTIGDIAIKVTSHSDINGSNSFNRKLTQKRADNIASYIKKRYKAIFINAIGYGEEFPLSKESNSSNQRVEIYLKRIYHD